MSMDSTSKVLEFVSFCIEMYAREYNMQGSLVSSDFEKNGIIDYLFDNSLSYRKSITFSAFCTERKNMTVINQNNLRSILPGKIAQAASLIAKEKECSPKEALLLFYSSDVYKNLENESTKCWWLSPYQLYEDVMRKMK